MIVHIASDMQGLDLENCNLSTKVRFHFRLEGSVADNVDEIDIVHLARLARLKLTEDEASAVLGDLKNIIAMIDAMQSVDTGDTTPMANPMDSSQRLRADTVSETVDRENFQANAPATEAGYYLVPRVVE